MISHNRRVSGRDTQNVRRVETYPGPPGPNMIIGGGQALLSSSHSPPNPFAIRPQSPAIDSEHPQTALSINTLPSELIYEIFAQFVMLEGPPSIAADAGPMLLLQVCAHWRALTLSLPSLWSSFCVGRGDHYPRIALVKQWLAYAGPLTPLTLRFERPAFADRVQGAALMDFFLPHAHRWREVSLELDVALANWFVNASRRGVPALEAAHLKLGASLDAADVGLVLEHLKHCERLTRLSLLAARGYLSPISTIPWARLTWIHLECGMKFVMWIAILRRCSEVVNLSMKPLRVLGYPPVREAVSVFPHLRNVTVNSLYDAGKLLLYFALPALDNLSLSFTFPPLPQDLDMLLKRSPVTKLALRCNHLREDAILEYVSRVSFNSVRELVLTSRLVGDDVVRALTFSDKPGAEFLRSLEKLTLGRYIGTRESFMQMVTSRCRPGKSGLARLRAVTVLEKENQYSEDLGYLAEQIILQQPMLY